MAGIRKREWITKKGVKKYCYEITYYLNGKLYRKSGFKTKIEAQNALPNVINNLNSSISFKQLVEEYIHNRKIRCKASTITKYNNYFKCNLVHLHNKKAKEIKQLDIEKTIQLYCLNGFSNKTINCIIMFLRSVFNYGIKLKLFAYNPAKEIDTLPIIKTKLQYLNEDEINMFIEYIKEFPLKKEAPLFTAINTGLRIGELLALEWSDIDFKNKQISINKQVQNNIVTSPKTYTSSRIIDVPESVINMLKNLKQENKVLSKIVFSGTTNGYMKRNYFIKNWFKKVMKKLGHEDYTFHSLRHTYATYLLSKGIPIKYVQQQLGHSSAETLLKTYAHVLPSSTHQAMKVLEKIEYEQDMSISNFKH